LVPHNTKEIFVKIKSMSLVLALVLSALPGHSFAANLDDLTDRAYMAATILDEVVRMPEDAIPESLLKNAECVATIPNVIRIGLIYGGRYGQGLVSCRVPGGWSAPSFISIAGASWGFQIGIQSIDVVLVFTRANAVEKFSKANLTLGGDATIAAGPLGREAQIGTDYTLTSEIYSYSRSRGLFFGVALQGNVLTVDKDANEMVYGSRMSANDILTTEGSRAPQAGMEYVLALKSHAPTAN
jgi:lipid-binding SYLF domain-containing protein